MWKTRSWYSGKIRGTLTSDWGLQFSKYGCNMEDGSYQTIQDIHIFSFIRILSKHKDAGTSSTQEGETSHKWKGRIEEKPMACGI